MSEWLRVLKALEELEWRGSRRTVDYIAALANRSQRSVLRLLEMSRRQGLVTLEFDGWHLTDRGRVRARR